MPKPVPPSPPVPPRAQAPSPNVKFAPIPVIQAKLPAFAPVPVRPPALPKFAPLPANVARPVPLAPPVLQQKVQQKRVGLPSAAATIQPNGHLTIGGTSKIRTLDRKLASVGKEHTSYDTIQWFRNDLRQQASKITSLRSELATLRNRINVSFDDGQHRILVLGIFERLMGLDSWLRGKLLYFEHNPSPWTGAVVLYLARLERQIVALARALNDYTAQGLGINRAGPGGRPDAKGGLAPDESTLGKSDLTFRKKFIEANKGKSKKPDEEAMTAIYAMNSLKGEFGKIEPWDKSLADFEYGINGQPWDQKTIYWDATDFDGRLEHTHTKEGYKAGILLDSTFVEYGNYQRTWLILFQKILSNAIPKEYIREVRAPDPESLPSKTIIDETAKKSEAERAIIYIDLLCTDGATLPSEKLDEDYLLGIIKGTQKSFSFHRNARGWLPGGVSYWEFEVGRNNADAKMDRNGSRYVVATDLSGFYLSTNHYHGFTIIRSTGQVNRKPFYRIVLSERLQRAVTERLSSKKETASKNTADFYKKQREKAAKDREESGLPEPDRRPPKLVLPSKWRVLAINVMGYPGSADDTISTLDVLLEITRTREFEGYGTFWEAYHAFRKKYNALNYLLSPVDVIKMLTNRNPTTLYIMHHDDWDVYRKFKREHAQEYSFSH